MQETIVHLLKQEMEMSARGPSDAGKSPSTRSYYRCSFQRSLRKSDTDNPCTLSSRSSSSRLPSRQEETDDRDRRR
jgi:hypothetical protein